MRPLMSQIRMNGMSSLVKLDEIPKLERKDDEVLVKQWWS